MRHTIVILLGLLIVLVTAPLGRATIEIVLTSDFDTVANLAGLDMSQVRFHVNTGQHIEYTAVLTAKAVARLKAGGIYKEPVESTPMSLDLDLSTYPAVDGRSDLVIYAPSLVLYEEAILSRSQRLVGAATYYEGQAAGARKPVPLEELERDMNHYLNMFIAAYRTANHLSAK